MVTDVNEGENLYPVAKCIKTFAYKFKQDFQILMARCSYKDIRIATR